MWRVKCPGCGETCWGEAAGFRESYAAMEAWEVEHVGDRHPLRLKTREAYPFHERVVWPDAPGYRQFREESGL